AGGGARPMARVPDRRGDDELALRLDVGQLEQDVRPDVRHHLRGEVPAAAKALFLSVPVGLWSNRRASPRTMGPVATNLPLGSMSGSSNMMSATTPSTMLRSPRAPVSCGQTIFPQPCRCHRRLGCG